MTHKMHVNDNTIMSFSSTQPNGGVKEGQVFEVPLPGDFSSEVTPFLSSGTDKEEAPLGKWSDSLFDCTRHGYFHSSLWNAICCPQLLMAQILTRMRMSWLGEENIPDHEWRRTFRRMFVVVCLYWGVTPLLAPPAPILLSDPATGNVLVAPPQSTQPRVNQFLYRLSFWLFSLSSLFLMTRLRRAVRRRYEIPLVLSSVLGAFSPLEDLCVSFWCGCCAVAQMARQTADYDRQTAACCSTTGLGTQSNFPTITV